MRARRQVVPGRQVLHFSGTTVQRHRPRPMRLEELTVILESYATGHIDLDAVHRQLLPVLVADPLDVELSGSEAWDEAADESRLFWRLIYLFESETADSDQLRRAAGRLVACLR